MRILAVLWTVCLVRICNASWWDDCFGGCCGKNEESEEAYKPVEQTQATPSESPIEASSEVQDSLASQPDDTSSENVVSEPENIPSDPGVINVSNPDSSQCQSFDYSFAGNAIKLIIPKNGQSITKLMAGMDIVWEAQVGETLEYAKAYLNKDGHPELVYLVLRSSGTIKDHYLELKDGNWEHCSNYDDKMNGLATSTEWVSDFALDISGDKDTNNCTIFEVELLGVGTKQFYPKPGYFATKVKNGENDLWTGQSHSLTLGGSVDRCRSCIIYKKDGKELLEMTLVVENYYRRKKYYEKNGQEWKEIKNKEDFDEKLKEMMTTTTKAPNDS